MEPAAGLAGLMKAALVLFHRRIPPSIGFDQLNPKIRFEDYRLAVNNELIDLPVHDTQAHALVNSFGFGGTNGSLLFTSPD